MPTIRTIALLALLAAAGCALAPGSNVSVYLGSGNGGDGGDFHEGGL